MVALFCLFLALFASPFKSKSRLEAENAALRHQLIIFGVSAGADAASVSAATMGYSGRRRTFGCALKLGVRGIGC
jgi:hypothetical protein